MRFARLDWPSAACCTARPAEASSPASNPSWSAPSLDRSTAWLRRFQLRMAPEHESGSPSELIKQLNGSQRLVEIGDQIFLVLDPNRQLHQPRRDAQPLAILVTERGVRGAGRMRSQRFHAAQRLCIQEQLERAEEAAR